MNARVTGPTWVVSPSACGSAGEKADLARQRRRRLVWVQDGELLRAVPVSLGLIDHQYAELTDGELTDGEPLVTGMEGTFASR